MPLSYHSIISRAAVRSNRDWLFVFGDNLERRGYGGQASQMRGEPNAIGLPTKRSPAMTEDAFFSNDPVDLFRVMAASQLDQARLIRHITSGGTIIWPQSGIGTGLAQLKTRAVVIYAYWKFFEKLLIRISQSQTQTQPESK